MWRVNHSVALNLSHWVPASLDKGWFIQVPPSTAYDGPKIKYWHPEACSGGCTCEPDTDGK